MINTKQLKQDSYKTNFISFQNLLNVSNNVTCVFKILVMYVLQNNKIICLKPVKVHGSANLPYPTHRLFHTNRSVVLFLLWENSKLLINTNLNTQNHHFYLQFEGKCMSSVIIVYLHLYVGVCRFHSPNHATPK